MPKYSHAYDIAFEVISDNENGDDVTPEMLVQALLTRIILLSTDEEMIEATGCPFDTYEVLVQ
jgi:hypothetical protein